MLFWKVTESQTASHVCNSRHTTLPRAVLDPDNISKTAFLPSVPCTVFENHWHGKSKHLSKLINVSNFLPNLHGLVMTVLSISLLAISWFTYSSTHRLRKHIQYFPELPKFGGCGNSGAQAILSAHTLINADNLGTRLSDASRANLNSLDLPQSSQMAI